MTCKYHPRICIDARPTMGGIARYTHELGNLIKNCQYKTQVLLYGHRQAEGFNPIGSAHSASMFWRKALGGSKRILTDQLLLPIAAFQFNADLIHSTNYFVPLMTSKPVAVNCYDLSLIHYFSSKKSGAMKYYERFLFLNGLKRAAHIIVPSNSVADELKDRCGIPDNKVTTIYPPLPSFCFAAPAEKKEINHSVLKPPFFLSVGTIEPRKNVSLMLQGWRRAYAECNIPLVLVGQYGWQQRKLLEEQLSVSKGLYWIEDADDTTLADLYRKATAVVQFSLAEGFDYPVAEALCLGTPVVASDIAVHREVMAGNGLLASPAEPEELASMLVEVSTWSDKKVTEFKRRANLQARVLKQFSTAEHYFSVYQHILGVGK